MQDRRLQAAFLLASAIILFQLFGRYSYTYYRGFAVERIDRLTGSVCRMPCRPPTPTPPTAPPTAQPTPNLDLEDQRAIQMVRFRRDALEQVSEVAEQPDAAEYAWHVYARYTNDGRVYDSRLVAMCEDLLGSPAPTSDPSPYQCLPEYPVRVVWYAKAFKDGSYRGYAWEAHLDTGEVFPVGGNAALEAKYYGSPAPVATPTHHTGPQLIPELMKASPMPTGTSTFIGIVTSLGPYDDPRDGAMVRFRVESSNVDTFRKDPGNSIACELFRSTIKLDGVERSGNLASAFHRGSRYTVTVTKDTVCHILAAARIQ